MPINNSGTSLAVPENVRAQATGFQYNCALNNLIPDIACVMQHHEGDITAEVRKEAVEAFNKVWKTNVDWRQYKEIFLGIQNPVRREVM